jgi:hypothetical protein
MGAARWNRTVFGVAAAIEAVTGLFLLIVPHLLVKLLLGVDATGVAILIGRVAGIALLSLGLGCWANFHALAPEQPDRPPISRP